MTLISAQKQFTIQDAEEYQEEVDLLILPENSGTDALRELHYPGDVYAPVVYPDMPDRWTNFDTSPLTARPISKTEMTLTGNKTARWPGYVSDFQVKEMWLGSDNRSRMTMYFFRRLVEYFLNPPDTGYIVWKPKDRTTTSYNVVLESLDVGGQSVLTFDYFATYGDRDMMTLQVELTLRVVGEVS